MLDCTDAITRSVENLVAKTKVLNEDDAVKFATLGGYIDFTANRSSDDILNFVVEMGEKVLKDRMTMSSDE